MAARPKKPHPNAAAAKPHVPAPAKVEMAVTVPPVAAKAMVEAPAVKAAAPEAAAKPAAAPVVAPVSVIAVKAPAEPAKSAAPTAPKPAVQIIAGEPAVLEPLVKIEGQIRSAAESAIVEGRKSFETAKVKAQGLTSAVEASAGTLSKGIQDLNAKSISVLKTNIETGFDHMKALFGAKTIFDAWKLHADLSAKQLAVLNEQAKDLATTASKFASESVQPIKNSLEQAFSR